MSETDSILDPSQAIFTNPLTGLKSGAEAPEPQVESSAEESIFLQKYAERHAVLEKRLEYRRQQVENAKARATAQTEQFRVKKGREPRPGLFDGQVIGAERALHDATGQLEFIRPGSAEKQAYELKVERELPAKILAATPDGLPLRFHAAPIYRSRDIIKSHGLSSSVDRLGITTSFDVAGQVSVTMPETLVTSLGTSYSGLLEEGGNIPPGCIFVMLPESAEDAESGTVQMMGNIDFNEQPDRLMGIMTAEENLPLVREWAADAGIDPAKVDEYFAFTDKLATIKTDIAAGRTSLADHIPYAS